MPTIREIHTPKGLQLTVVKQMGQNDKPWILINASDISITGGQLLTLGFTRATPKKSPIKLPIGIKQQIAEELSTTEKGIHEQIASAILRHFERNGTYITVFDLIQKLKEEGLLSSRFITDAKNEEQNIIIDYSRRNRTRPGVVIKTDTGKEAELRGSHAIGGKAVMVICNDVEVSVRELETLTLLNKLLEPVLDIGTIASRRGVAKQQIWEDFSGVLRRNSLYNSIEEVIKRAEELDLFEPRVLMDLQAILDEK